MMASNRVFIMSSGPTRNVPGQGGGMVQRGPISWDFCHRAAFGDARSLVNVGMIPSPSRRFQAQIANARCAKAPNL